MWDRQIESIFIIILLLTLKISPEEIEDPTKCAKSLYIKYLLSSGIKVGILFVGIYLQIGLLFWQHIDFIWIFVLCNKDFCIFGILLYFFKMP